MTAGARKGCGDEGVGEAGWRGGSGCKHAAEHVAQESKQRGSSAHGGREGSY